MFPEGLSSFSFFGSHETRWRGELAGCRKFAPSARNYAAARLMAEVGLRVNGMPAGLGRRQVGPELVGKIHVQMGKGARGSGPRERMVSLINNSGARLAWFVQDVWGHFDDDHTRAGAPLLPSEQEPRRDLRPGRE
jgi:integrase/recombinase XerD